ncbi:TauD/TfdA dioxygenase family protein [Thalassobaculum litoreum]|uniref:Taurine dioxygenase n=1 Tax=Thalassobaculum litoreum DSM 18839 TaxID=1123362 RepID=A0A8G2F3D5_9PROT|nr:TauD/TfdA family dioxygenase [Thalassobaculum litoreum]SDF85055.1 taurine dioxygenase [Thalassobaculum litoreum DSM 18839]
MSDTAQSASMGMDARPLTPVVGAEILGIDLGNVDDAQFAFIRQAFDRHAGLLFRGQDLSPEQLVAFSRRFGELDHAPIMENGQTAVPGLPEVYLVSNIKGPDGKEIGSLGAGEAVWHTDMSYLAAPPDISMLHAIEVPPAGGDTWLCGMNAAYNALPEELKRRVKGLRIKHDGTYNSGGYVRQGVTPTDDPRESPGTYHPVVIAHPNTGQPLLYLGRRRMAHIEGLDLAESEALLDELWSYATREENAYRHHWRIGDVLMWDNRATMHRRDPFDAASRRLMRRTQVKGALKPAAYAG